MSAALLLALALQTSPASVTVPQLTMPERAGAASVAADGPTLADTGAKSRGALATAPEQVGDGRRTAEATPDLTSRARGRDTAAAPVGGADRCDPASGRAETELCRRRLETRAGEFASTGAAPVTAEARLLILSDPQPGPQTVDGMTRRLGTTSGVDTLAGSAANTLAGAIATGRTETASTQASAAAAGSATGLPAGVPSTVVLTPH